MISAAVDRARFLGPSRSLRATMNRVDARGTHLKNMLVLATADNLNHPPQQQRRAQR